MPQSRTAEGEQLLEVIERIHEAGSDPGLWPQALAYVRAALNGNVCRVLTHDYRTHTGRSEYSINARPEYDRKYAEYASRDVWLQREEFFRSSGAVWTERQLVPLEDLVKSEFYADFLRHQDIFYSLIGVIERTGSQATLIGVSRPRSMEPFGDVEVGMLRRLLPALQSTLRIQRQVRGAELMKTAALGTLEVLPFGVCILDADARVLAANQVAREIFVRHDGLTLSRERLVIADRASRDRLGEFLAWARTPEEARSGTLTGEILVPSPSQARPLCLLLAPCHSADGIRNGDHPVATAFVIDSDRPVLLDERRLQRVYQLTPAEARLAALLAEGWPLREAARKLGISYQTARTHLRHVLSKTMTDRQPELVRLILRGPAPILA
jgi:DNA-binding CsgD family transcriptional regulator/PAS domain-containing protein